MTQLMAHPGNGEMVTRRTTVMGSMAGRYGMDPNRLLETLRATCIKGNATNEQVAAFCIVAQKYGLDPFLKELHAFAAQGGGIVPIVGIDGWSKIANHTGKMNGVGFAFDGDGPDLSCTCTVYVKGREHPVEITEYLSECKRNTPPWNQYPRRMLRHRAFIQAVRLAFGLGGIYDEDEARDVIRNESNVPAAASTDERLAAARRLEHTQLPDDEIATRLAASDAPAPPTVETPAVASPDAASESVEPGVQGADAEPPVEGIPPEGRTSSKWIDDLVTMHKPKHFSSSNVARKAFHATDVASWDKLTPARQDEKWRLLTSGEFPWPSK